MSLVLSRKPGQSFRVGTEVFITVVQCGHGETRISIDAPKQVSIARSELEESSDYPDSGHAPRKAATSAKRTKRFARRRRGYRKSGTAVGIGIVHAACEFRFQSTRLFRLFGFLVFGGIDLSHLLNTLLASFVSANRCFRCLESRPAFVGGNRRVSIFEPVV